MAHARKSKFAEWNQTGWLVQDPRAKIFRLPIAENPHYLDNIPPRFSEGRIANVTRREAGMRWTRMCQVTIGADADGEIVWSWRFLTKSMSQFV